MTTATELTQAYGRPLSARTRCKFELPEFRQVNPLSLSSCRRCERDNKSHEMLHKSGVGPGAWRQGVRRGLGRGCTCTFLIVMTWTIFGSIKKSSLEKPSLKRKYPVTTRVDISVALWASPDVIDLTSPAKLQRRFSGVTFARVK